MKKISIIVAIAQNFAIGRENKLLWHISDDLKRFKLLTTGHWVIMGKKTFESLPNGALSNRINLVISDIPGEKIPGCEMAYSIDEAINKSPENEECFIIGGGSVYRQFLPLAQKIYLTIVHEDFEADTFFPQIDFNEWQEILKEYHTKDEKTPFDYTYLILERQYVTKISDTGV